MGLDSVFLVFIRLVLIGCGDGAAAPFVFSSQVCRCRRRLLLLILIIILLIIVTYRIHSIFVVRQQEQLPPTRSNKGPTSTDEP